MKKEVDVIIKEIKRLRDSGQHEEAISLGLLLTAFIGDSIVALSQKASEQIGQRV